MVGISVFLKFVFHPQISQMDTDSRPRRVLRKIVSYFVPFEPAWFHDLDLWSSVKSVDHNLSSANCFADSSASSILDGSLPPAWAISGRPPPPPPTMGAVCLTQ